MMKHHSRDGGDRGVRDRSKNVVTAAGMRSHHRAFLIVEAAGFEKDAIRDADLADVVKFRRPAQDPQAIGRQPEHATGLDAERAGAVAVREGIFIALRAALPVALRERR